MSYDENARCAAEPTTAKTSEVFGKSFVDTKYATLSENETGRHPHLRHPSRLGHRRRPAHGRARDATGPPGAKFALHVTERIHGQIVGGMTYCTEVPWTIYLPIVLRGYGGGS